MKIFFSPAALSMKWEKALFGLLPTGNRTLKHFQGIKPISMQYFMFLNKKRKANKQLVTLEDWRKNKHTSVNHQIEETFPGKFQHPELL